MTLDWRRLKAVVLESDDWGLCAWVPDEQAYQALSDTPAWRSPPARAYGRSTLEHAEDVARLVDLLLGFRGREGWAPVLQANTVMAAPDFARLEPPRFECDALPLLHYPEFPSRWPRPGMFDQVRRGIEAGVWWPELHGLLHLPQAAWLAALRSGASDARRAHAEQCFVCEAVEASAEYDPSEPAETRTRNLSLAVKAFRRRFGRSPGSLCAPDYRWDRRLEDDAEALGLTTLQGLAEQMGHRLPRLRHVLRRHRGSRRRGRRFYLPARIAFEPRGSDDPGSRLGAAAVHRAVRTAWGRGQPAVVSSHRANYANLDPAWSEAGRRALGDLLGRLARDGAAFLTDAEVRDLDERGWSLRPLGDHAALLRSGGPRGRLRFPAPPGVAGVEVREARASDPSPGSEPRRASEPPGAGGPLRATDPCRVALEDDQVVAEVGPGAWRLEWRRA